MDYLRNLGSAAVSTIVQKSGLNLPFTLGHKVSEFEGIWTLYDGTKREDGSSVSIFEYDFSGPSKVNTRQLAKNALKKLRTTRHPDVLKFMDAVETDTTIHVMTERVRPLPVSLDTWATKAASEREDWLLWGLHKVSIALAFVNGPAASTHGNLRPNSIFISTTGEWKLGGFELLSNPKDDAAILYTLGGSVPSASLYSSAEVKKSGYSALKDEPTTAADSYALGILIHEFFNPDAPHQPTTKPPHPAPTAANKGAIPNSVFPSFKKLLHPNPKVRLSTQTFLDLGMAQTAGEGAGFFANNRLVKVCAGLDGFNLASEGEKASLIRTLGESANSFPPEFANDRVLPSLISALDFGGTSASAILPVVLQLGKNVSPDDYNKAVLAHIIKLFASPDRAMRMALLDHLPEYADKLEKKVVVDQIWPHLQTGFSDTVAVVREATVKSISLLSPKINDRILNNDLLRFLARAQSDPEASIRTNTCILIGRLGPTLGYNTKRKVLVPAFTRALRDPFVHARVAGLMAFMATIDCFEIEELASKVIPNMSFSLLDREKLVRDQAFKSLNVFVKKLEAHAATMPESAPADEGLSIQIPGTNLLPSVPGQATIVASAAGAAGTLAGWAISSIGKRIASGDLQSTINSVANANLERPTSAPGFPGGLPEFDSGIPSRPPLTAANLTFSSPAVPSHSTLAPRPSKAKGMQLGAKKVPTSTLADQLAEEAAMAEASTEGNPWGTDDLIDVNADEGDWSAFETAPVPTVDLHPAPMVTINSSNGASAWDNLGSPENDPWAETSTPSYPSLSTNTKPRAPTTPTPKPVASPALSPRPTRATTPLPASDSWDSPSTDSKSPALSSMSKDEKAAEMARRKEERKQRIAQLKEQKKAAGAK